MTPFHQLTSCEAKSDCKKLINFEQTVESSIYNITLFSEQVISSESGEKYAQINHCL